MKSSLLQLRSARPSDANAISDLLKQMGFPQSPAATAAKLDAAFKEAADQVWVATEEERIIGFLSFHLFSFFHTEVIIGRITAMAVNAADRGKGAARMLVSHAEAHCRDKRCARIEATLGNPGSHEFYEKMGFEENSGKFVKNL